MEALLRDVVREPATPFGHSLGGEVALFVAAHAPGLVHAVILEDAALSSDAARRAIEPTGPGLLMMRELAGSTLPIDELPAMVAKLPIDLASSRGILLGDVAGEDVLKMYAESFRPYDPTMLDAVMEFEDMHAGYDDAILAAVRCPC